jgi:hypothetical protein
MRTALAVVAAIATLGAASFASARPQTTQPNVVYTIPAVLTDKTIKLSHTVLPRGTVIRYTVVNRGSRPYALEIGKAATRAIPPHRRARIRVSWDYRGRFVYRTLYRGRPTGPHGSITVI